MCAEMSGAETAWRRVVQRRIGGAEMTLPPLSGGTVEYLSIFRVFQIYGGLFQAEQWIPIETSRVFSFFRLFRVYG